MLDDIVSLIGPNVQNYCNPVKQRNNNEPQRIPWNVWNVTEKNIELIALLLQNANLVNNEELRM